MCWVTCVSLKFSFLLTFIINIYIIIIIVIICTKTYTSYYKLKLFILYFNLNSFYIFDFYLLLNVANQSE